ncbi:MULTISPECIES: siderophore ABC transporter substrate-binding protein [Vitreoscilla]|uniref:ABC transporter substrate-binding protein n=1 Tax=Vitreoscilla stercoraria TaxID=61 RepID=A0ABY4E6U7_VITST|nr:MULTISPECIES: ABC transporter substrate-binding protein [Vitreoscilla]AUZ04842.2 iron ABC transporter substrate-binding protein [Vitreoscilla sp. C1]UOO91492.1 ABC transporter substrate-binding protein [Vitreoscilla stercoraria]
MKRLIPALLAATVAVALSACGGNTEQTANTTAAASAPATASNTASAQQIQLQGKLGTTLVPANVARIAALDYTTIDTLMALGATDKIIGLPLASNVPSSLDSFKNGKYIDFGAVNNINLETLASNQPELIISADRLEKQNDSFKQIAPTYQYHIDTANYWPSFKEQTLNIAKVVGKTAEAEQKLQTLETQVSEIAAKTQGKTALIVLVNNDKLMAFGAGSRFGLIHEKMGFTPVDPSIKVGTHGQSISYEFITEKNPDYLFVLDRAASVTGKTGGAEAAMNNDIIKQSKAFKDGKIVYLNTNNWYLMNGGLNAMQEMIVEVQNVVK